MSEIKFTPTIDYEGVAKVLAQIVELYKVSENKQLVDECLKHFIQPVAIWNK